jgi:transcriptional regulator with XRE-family HTH domain
MSDRSDWIARLLSSQESRTSYIKSKLAVLVPAQIRTLRMASVDPPMPYQRDLAREADMQQSRISMFETPGAANMTLETIAKIAAGLRVGVVLKFVPFHEMLDWENAFSPDTFGVVRLPQDDAFLHPVVTPINEQINPMGALAGSGQNDLVASSSAHRPRQNSLSVVGPEFSVNQSANGAA